MKYMLGAILCLYLMLLTSCGESLYSHSEEVDSSDSIQYLLEYATEVSDYLEVIDAATLIIDDPNSTQEEIADANINLAYGYLGSMDYNALEFAAELNKIDTSSTEEDADNIIDAIIESSESTNIDDLLLAASAMEAANDIQLILPSTRQDLLKIDENDMDEFVADTTVVGLENNDSISLATIYLLVIGKVVDMEIAYTDNEIEGCINDDATDTSCNFIEVGDTFFSDYTLVDYVDAGFNYLTASDAFDSDVLENVDDLRRALVIYKLAYASTYLTYTLMDSITTAILADDDTIDLTGKTLYDLISEYPDYSNTDDNNEIVDAYYTAMMDTEPSLEGVCDSIDTISEGECLVIGYDQSYFDFGTAELTESNANEDIVTQLEAGLESVAEDALEFN